MSKRNHPPAPGTPPPEVKASVRQRPGSMARGSRLERGPAEHPPPSNVEVGAHRAARHHRRPPTEEEIARRAYEIWLQRGCSPGHEVEDWLQAEHELGWVPSAAPPAEQD